MPTNSCLDESHSGAARNPLYRKAKKAFSIFRPVVVKRRGNGRYYYYTDKTITAHRHWQKRLRFLRKGLANFLEKRCQPRMHNHSHTHTSVLSHAHTQTRARTLSLTRVEDDEFRTHRDGVPAFVGLEEEGVQVV